MTDLAPVTLEHAGASMTGLMARPVGDGPFPAVLVMHNALGIGPHVREVCQRLAAEGYVAVASDMYGGGAAYGAAAMSGASFEALMKDPALLRERIVKWFEHLCSLPEVDGARAAAIGFCFGGTCVLELARSGASARAVVSYHGILTSAQPMQPGAFSGEVQAWCGARDSYAPLDQIEGLRAELAGAGTRHTITIFGEAAHGFTDPAADAMGREGIAYHALSDRVSWAGTLALLAAVFES